MSETRKELCRWLATKEVKGKTLDIGGNVWSMRNKVKSFEGNYIIVDESDVDLNYSEWNENALFSNIFCTEVMQFVFNPINALRVLYDRLRDNGKLYLSFHLTHEPMKGHDYLRYTEKGIRKLLEVTGFKIDEFLEPLPGYFLVECHTA